MNTAELLFASIIPTEKRRNIRAFLIFVAESYYDLLNVDITWPQWQQLLLAAEEKNSTIIFDYLTYMYARRLEHRVNLGADVNYSDDDPIITRFIINYKFAAEYKYQIEKIEYYGAPRIRVKIFLGDDHDLRSKEYYDMQFILMHVKSYGYKHRLLKQSSYYYDGNDYKEVYSLYDISGNVFHTAELINGNWMAHYNNEYDIRRTSADHDDRINISMSLPPKNHLQWTLIKLYLEDLLW